MTVPQEIHFDTGRRGDGGRPVYCPGELVSGTVQIVPDADANTRGVWLWVGCRVHGSGTAETVDLVPERMIHEGPLSAGMPITARFEAHLPDTAPLSYQGRRVKFDWEVGLRVDIPIWPDRRYAEPFGVVPRRSGEGSGA